MPRTTPDRPTAARRRRAVALSIGTALVLTAGATTACAVVGLDPSGTLPEQLEAPAPAEGTVAGEPSAAPSSNPYTEVPLPQGVTMWLKPLPDGQAVYFVADREGDQVTTARVGMGGPRCFFGSAQDGVLQGRYRVITAGSGLDQQADPVRVTIENDTITLTERATGEVLGEYSAIDPADTDAVAAAQAALSACDTVRAAPATATPN